MEWDSEKVRKFTKTDEYDLAIRLATSLGEAWWARRLTRRAIPALVRAVRGEPLSRKEAAAIFGAMSWWIHFGTTSVETGRQDWRKLHDLSEKVKDNGKRRQEKKESEVKMPEGDAMKIAMDAALARARAMQAEDQARKRAQTRQGPPEPQAKASVPASPDALCSCGHQARWHSDRPLAPGSGECEFLAECVCKEFLAA